MRSGTKFWITLSLFNLALTAFLGMILRTKFLFPIPFLDYKNFLSAHTHFAFGGWIALALMVLLIASLLKPEQAARKAYQYILWGIEITSLGMAVSFPFDGYATVSIIFSTMFIFFTYGFGWYFIKDMLNAGNERPVPLLAIAAVGCLVLSSVGPFTLAYIMATGWGDTVIYHDAIYTFLHFQYNGFFTLSVLALFLHKMLPLIDPRLKRVIRRFSLFIVLSVPPSLFMSLSWHPRDAVIYTGSAIGCILLFIALIFFLRFIFSFNRSLLFSNPIARMLLFLSLLSFVIKIILQMLMIVPQIADTVFGFRPIIIGFLHLVFLGLVTFYILAHLVETGELNMQVPLKKKSIIILTISIILNEGILLVQGLGLLMGNSKDIYAWLLWIVSILLFISSLMVFLSRVMVTKVLDRK